jgi:hypothetical protein
MNEHQPNGDVRKVGIAGPREIQRQKRLLSETDQLLREPHHLISRSQELIREHQRLKRLPRDVSCGRYQPNDVHEDRTDEDDEDSVIQQQRIPKEIT